MVYIERAAGPHVGLFKKLVTYFRRFRASLETQRTPSASRRTRPVLVLLSSTAAFSARSGWRPRESS